jgi:hypothetical protein
VANILIRLCRRLIVQPPPSPQRRLEGVVATELGWLDREWPVGRVGGDGFGGRSEGHILAIVRKVISPVWKKLYHAL